ncbi:hemin uptake protein HemP [Paraburkholderia ferrariae]|uniref:hemin uptake protein HemP n=1 Tax=Paraburkholderia ferrariae TaxID=386056 RepID=UPI00048333A4|nr:hemin uptake protein HemP [Paraburkholderia ferrariae]
MTDFNRSSTLSLRRSGGPALTAPRAASTQAPKAAVPAQTRKSAPAHEGANAAANGAPSNERTLDSTALLQGRSHVSILHNGETYQLRATRLGKLILTK